MRIPTVAFTLAVGVALTLSMVTACDDDDDLIGIIEDAEFIVPVMGGGFERPDPVASEGSGRAFFEFDDDNDEMNFRVEVEDIQDVTLAHIHFGDEGVAGPIVVELFNDGGSPEDFEERDVLAEGSFEEDDIDDDSGITTMDELLEAMEAGDTYVNVHTTTNPAGEIRGQIAPVN